MRCCLLLPLPQCLTCLGIEYMLSVFLLQSLHEGKVKNSICFKINLNAIHLPILFSNVATHLWS